jgi:hypothetical protein
MSENPYCLKLREDLADCRRSFFFWEKQPLGLLDPSLPEFVGQRVDGLKSDIAHLEKALAALGCTHA